MRSIVLILLLFALPATLLATPYVAPETLSRQAEHRAVTVPPGVAPLPGGYPALDELDDLQGRFLTVEYRRLLEWLTLMQELAPGSPDFGGQHEGETSTWDIVQTDNTQEALRDWSHYASWTGDTQRFATNIDAAWIYTFNYPAYLEEGGGDPNYYRVHNCGWGLVAAMEYTEAYGADPNVLAYADSCASYIDTWRLSWTGQGVELNPLAASFGAGTLHSYAQWRDNPDWETAAEEIATNVKAWIEADPDRLNSNETWAMSGGTAMWGVITALFLDDPDAGEAWLPDYLPHMDTYSGAGSWNNSWTVWYGFAWQRAHQVLGTDETLDNALWVANYLLDQGALDDDAGIPGTEGTYEDDQSWTSAYMVWYELEQLLAMEPMEVDVAAVEFVEPQPGWPLLVGQSIPVSIRVANAGMLPLPPEALPFDVLVEADGSPVTSGTGGASFGEIVLWVGPNTWEPTAPGTITLSATVSTSWDIDPGNDLITREFVVHAPRLVSGTVTDSLNGEPLDGMIHWELLGTDPPFMDSVSVNPATGTWSFEAAPGEYRIVADPVETPYNTRTRTVTVDVGDVENVDFTIPPATVGLVSTSPSAESDSLLIHSLAALGYEAVWLAHSPLTPMMMAEPPFELAILHAGAGAQDTLFADVAWDGMMSLLESGDGRGVILSGDHLVNGLTVTQLADLGVEGEALDLVNPIVAGDPDGFLAGDSLFIGGLLPQEAVDRVTPLFLDFHAEGRYANTDFGSGVGYTFDDNRLPYVVLGHGVIGVNDFQGRFLSREEYLTDLLTLLGVQTGAPDVPRDVAAPVRPAEYSLAAWPNPFNPVLRVQVAAPAAGTLRLVNVLGQEVASWPVEAGQHTVTWQARGHASGVYLLVLTGDGQVITRRVTLLR